MLASILFLMTATLSSSVIITSFPVSPYVTVAPGVTMPTVNLGGVHGKPSNYSLFLELGGRGIDTALVYGDDIQQEVGAAVRASSLPRDKIFVTTKVPCCPAGSFATRFCGNGSRDTSADLRHDLEMLGLEYVDLMLVHWPCESPEDTLNTYAALEQMHKDGKARAIGVSNFVVEDMKLILSNATVPPAVNQCAMSIGKHDDASIKFSQEHNITYQAYSPLGGLSHIDVLSDPDVKAIANSYGVSPAQVALRWVAQAGAILVTAADKQAYMEEDLDIFGFELKEHEMAKLASK
mmetsp:Transcript_16453/g.22965  ORF Transcript_16453/g.22965 Transcript_16453/m.22965 type:complete len:293 (+) Transcript_16453:64-942(+)|eukprot:CAMPEP_0184488854 /NCGR_PEP_ID=MMETSP0113_2-20130426/13737_1 /TAXON_ID=91329 /ORGANISM="Norrisiella sphaerica, Strain BC52" /LENGTH=292 /DNA_ID=CAMNT_0026871949 /DNA_START=34 /DNA_END=912 /DNA_ORIENTATION=-